MLIQKGQKGLLSLKTKTLIILGSIISYNTIAQIKQEFEQVVSLLWDMGINDSTTNLYNKFTNKYHNSNLSDSLSKIYLYRYPFRKGVQAPDMCLSNMFEKKVCLSSLKGQVIYISFWASWCSPCIEGIKKMKILKNEYLKDYDIKFVYIFIEKDLEKWKNLVNELNIEGINLIANSKEVLEKYQIPYLPYYFVIDKNYKFYSINPPRPLLNQGIDIINILKTAYKDN